MTRILAFLGIVAVFFLLEGGFFVQSSILSAYDFVFEQNSKPQVIFGGGYIFSEVFYVNYGSNEGAQKGDLAVYDSSIALGNLEEIFENNSKAEPFSKFGKKTPLRLGKQKEILFEGIGGGGGMILADFPNSVAIDPGDGAYLAENSNYLVGIVENIDKKEGRDFQKVAIMTPVSLKSVANIDIVKNDAEVR